MNYCKKVQCFNTFIGALPAKIGNNLITFVTYSAQRRKAVGKEQIPSQTTTVRVQIRKDEPTFPV